LQRTKYKGNENILCRRIHTWEDKPKPLLITLVSSFLCD
jgi:hypothetical protein